MNCAHAGVAADLCGPVYDCEATPPLTLRRVDAQGPSRRTGRWRAGRPTTPPTSSSTRPPWMRSDAKRLNKPPLTALHRLHNILYIGYYVYSCTQLYTTMHNDRNDVKMTRPPSATGPRGPSYKYTLYSAQVAAQPVCAAVRLNINIFFVMSLRYMFNVVHNHVHVVGAGLLLPDQRP